MKVLSWERKNINTISDYLIRGMVVAIPTETLYGLLTVADRRDSVEKVYKIKERNPVKPVIILISDLGDLERFGIELTNWQREYTEKYWPGAVSIILPCGTDKFEYLHRGTKTLAFRLPDDDLLKELLIKTGPLVAPSANPEGQEPGFTVQKIQEYFGEKVDLYVDGGIRNSPPSTLISLIDDKLDILRGDLNK